MLKAKLVVVGGDAKSTEVNLRLPCVIGRGREVTLTLPHPLVSRRHSEITEKDGRLYVRDMGSLNGTFVNNKRIEQTEPLDPNQLLTLGNVTFRAVYEISATTDVAPSAVTELVIATEKCEDEEQSVGGSEPVGSAPAAVVEGLSENEIEQTLDERREADEIAEKETVYDDEKNASDTDKSLPAIPAFEEVESSVEQAAADSDVIDEGRSSQTSASDIFIDDSGIVGAEDQSVSLSSLGDLPAGPANASFVGKVDFGDDDCEPAVESEIQIELDGENPPSVEEGSQLDSFLKKLPR